MKKTTISQIIVALVLSIIFMNVTGMLYVFSVIDKYKYSIEIVLVFILFICASPLGLLFVSGILGVISRIKELIRFTKLPLGKEVKVIIDRPIGSTHPEHNDLIYKVNYGYIEDVMGKDDEEQDAYILGVYSPVEVFQGRVIAIIHRLNDKEDKWVVAPEGVKFSKHEIMQFVEFQEKYFNSEIYM